MTDYDPFAHTYDRHWAPDAAERVAQILDDHVLADLPAEARVLDIGCGTGHLARILTDRGFDVVGIDISPKMLAIARQNAPDASFEVADARTFELDAPVQLALSTFDTFNHLLSTDDLGAAFHQVHAALADGGRFFFDLNTPQKYRHNWAHTFSVEDDDHFLTVRTDYDDTQRRASFRGTQFSADGDGRWTRSDFEIFERAYDAHTITDLLTASGFTDIDTHTISTDDQGRPFRWLFHARRA